MTSVRRILLISVKAGAGHIRAAAAIEAAARLHHPRVEVRNVEALDYTNPAFRRVFTKTYERLSADLPSVWKMVYEGLERKPVDSKAKRLNALFDRVNAKPLLRLVRDYDPDLIISTHYMAGEILGPQRLAGALRAPLNVVLTDYDIHTMWLQAGVDRYFVATPEMEHALRLKGAANAEVCVTGIPIMPVFGDRYPPRAEMRRRIGLRVEPPTVIVAAGGFGSANLKDTLLALAESVDDAQLLSIAGRNAEAKADIDAVAGKYPGKVRSYGFVNNMHELMAAADFIVTKSGGLASSECLAMGLPMVVYNPIPGQEERNADFLLECGAALRANSPAHLIYKTRRLLTDAVLCRQMSDAARRTGKPNAAADILTVAMAKSETAS